MKESYGNTSWFKQIYNIVTDCFLLCNNHCSITTTTVTIQYSTIATTNAINIDCYI